MSEADMAYYDDRNSSWDDPVYYKILVDSDDNKLNVVCLQSLDEITGYQNAKWFMPRQFKDKQEAEDIVSAVEAYVGKMLFDALFQKK